MVQQPDVLVIGLGPAGARAAAMAARAGLDVVALERKARPGQPVQCAEFVPTLLDQELDHLDAVTVQPIARMLTFVEAEPAFETPDFHGRMIDRAAFDAMLVDAARAAGADCRFGAVVASIGSDGTVTLADGSAYRPRVLIGCDGARSAVGAAIGQANTDLVETRQITVRLNRAHDATEIFLHHDIPGGYAWLFPKGDTANLGLGVAHWARQRLKPELTALHAAMVRTGRIADDIVCHTGGAIPVGGRRQVCGHLGAVLVLLAGDAAGLTNPVTGAGIAAAVQSGALAGEAAAGWLDGDDDAFADYDEDLGDLFDVSLARALRRRAGVLDCYRDGGQPAADDMRRGWIAYRDYWAD